MDIDELMRVALDGDAPSRERIDAQDVLIRKWRVGEALEPLIALLESEKTLEREFGAYFLKEIMGPVEGLRAAATKLSEDPLSECRRAFVDFMSDSLFYDDQIAKGLFDCLCDRDLGVRYYVILWAVGASNRRFRHFWKFSQSEMDKIDPKLRGADRNKRIAEQNEFWKNSHRNRARRGLEIISRLRASVPLECIRADLPGEDDFVYDSLKSSEYHLRNYVARNARFLD